MLGEGPRAGTRDALDRWDVPGAAVGVLAGGKTDARSYAVNDLAGGEPIHADTSFRVDSLPEDGPPRFAWIGSWLLPRC